jgi:hypothetical protein
MTTKELELLKSKEQKLRQASIELKEKFVGIDDIIDDLIENIKLWYLMP